MKSIVIFFLFLCSSVFVFSQDFSIWDIPECNIYGIGEESHGIESTLNYKLKLVSDLRKRFPQVQIWIEAPLVHSVINALERKSVQFLYPHTSTRYVRDSLSNWGALGFDVQEDCRFIFFSKYLREKGYVKDELIVEQDSVLNKVIGEQANRSVLTAEEEMRLDDILDHIRSSISERCEDSFERSMLLLCVESRRHLLHYLRIDFSRTRIERVRARDSLMALNVRELHRLLQPSHVVIWAANLHIAKKGGMGNWEKKGVKSMGEIVVGMFPQLSYYSIAIVEWKRVKRSRKKNCYDRVVADFEWLAIPPEQWQYVCP